MDLHLVSREQLPDEQGLSHFPCVITGGERR
jgi:hypothetical protein